MIKVDKEHLEIDGSNKIILGEVIMLVDELLDLSPEIINAVVAGFHTKLANSLEKCDPTLLNILVTVVEKYNERSTK